ncbi:ATP-binding protein [Rhodococcus sp. ARC_M6]|nr:ATP-binding protein [Rhodococcus sp. ARC_M6]MCJ0904695.1 ATP-binding protein [Rhodococcus sp. ARC_M6]
MFGSGPSTDDLHAGPELEQILREHAYRGAYLQLGVRGVLVVFIASTLIVVPPAHGSGWCFLILGLYVSWCVGLALWIGHTSPFASLNRHTSPFASLNRHTSPFASLNRHTGAGPVNALWLGLLVDLAVLATLTLLTGLTAQESWTADILCNGLFVIPVLACTQLRTDICAAIVAATIAVFFAASWATMASNEEPWASILLSTTALAALGVGAVGLTRIQRSRVLTIAELVGHRTSLLAELMSLEQRQRRALSEQLHDGALQYVLVARMDIDELGTSVDPLVRQRALQALSEATTLLRSSVAELHPTVLGHVGLARAIGDVARSVEGRGGLAVAVEASRWRDDLRTSADDILFGAARELLNNVVKHAAAANVRIELSASDRIAVLTVTDDGRGISSDKIAASQGRGHIGLLSHQLRVVAAGGSFSIGPGEPTGTVARVELPFEIVDDR